VIKEDLLGKEDGMFLIQNVLAILFKKAQTLDSAKCGGLMLLEVFSKEDLFGKETIENFVEQTLEDIKKDANFKT
jgi:hypothetical protein